MKVDVGTVNLQKTDNETMVVFSDLETEKAEKKRNKIKQNRKTKRGH